MTRHLSHSIHQMSDGVRTRTNGDWLNCDINLMDQDNRHLSHRTLPTSHSLSELEMLNHFKPLLHVKYSHYSSPETNGRLQGHYSQEWLNSQNHFIDCSHLHKCIHGLIRSTSFQKRSPLSQFLVIIFLFLF